MNDIPCTVFEVYVDFREINCIHIYCQHNTDKSDLLSNVVKVQNVIAMIEKMIIVHQLFSFCAKISQSKYV